MTVINMDCLAGMQLFGDNSIDAIVTDPPYELGFMGKTWDSTGIAYSVALWREALRVLKPGGHLLAFSGSRTYHRMACAIEDAGFEIRDQIMWIYGSGFPKSHNLDGAFEGWGTALKPAHEPICMARKPFPGTVAANMAKWGVGAIHIEASRIGSDPAGRASAPAGGNTWNGENCGLAKGGEARPVVGRWPANLMHDGSDEVVEAFPHAPGQMVDASVNSDSRGLARVYGVMARGHEASANSVNDGAVGFKMRPGARRLDAGSAARFFYCAKASRADRDEGCEAFDKKPLDQLSGTQNPGSFQSEGTDKTSRNNHPTVKPTELMRHLCRLITPPGGLILDLFVGSGSTGKAAKLEGFGFVGFELNADYVAIANARIKAAA